MSGPRPPQAAELAARKAALRATMRAARAQAAAAFDAKAFAGHAETVCAYLRASLEACGGGAIATYLSVGAEFPTGLLNARLRAEGIPLRVPCWDPAREAYFWGGLTDTLVPGPHGIPQPRDPTPADEAGIAIALVPGLAFASLPDGSRFARLGHGGGVYDRLLARLGEANPMSRAIGLCFDAQIVGSLPRGGHDRDVGQLITEDAFGQGDPILEGLAAGGRAIRLRHAP